MLSPPSPVSSPLLGEGLPEILANDCGAVPKRDACTRLPSADDLGCSTSSHDAFDIAFVDFEALASCDPTLDSFIGDPDCMQPSLPGLPSHIVPHPDLVNPIATDQCDIMDNFPGNNNNDRLRLTLTSSPPLVVSCAFPNVGALPRTFSYYFGSGYDRPPVQLY